MTINYDSSQVGLPYVRAHRITINYPEPGVALPWVTIEQAEAVKLAGTLGARHFKPLPFIQTSFDLTANGNTPIPLVSPDTGAPLVGPNGPMTTTLNMVMLGILAVVRQEQNRVEFGLPGPEAAPETPLPPEV